MRGNGASFGSGALQPDYPDGNNVENPPPRTISSAMEERLAKLEGSYDALKVVRPMTLAVVSILLAALVFVLGFFATQLNSLNGKIDAIPQRLAEEFRAMRTEMAAQTSAIANSITAARQIQQPAPPPSPQPAPRQQTPAPRRP
jgi:hypothetical protein